MGAHKGWLPGVLAAFIIAAGTAETAILIHRHAVAAGETAEATDAVAPTTPAGSLWSTTCIDGAKRMCAITQAVYYKDGPNGKPVPVMRVAVGDLAGDGTLRMALTLPLGVLIQAGVGIQIDQGKPEISPIESCLPGGCRAVLVIDGTGRQRLEASHVIRVICVKIGGQRIVLPVLLDGFAAALKRIGV